MPHRRYSAIRSCLAAATLSALLLPATAGAFNMHRIGHYATGLGEDSAEISAFDAYSERLFVISTGANSLDIVDLSNPTLPHRYDRIDLSGYGAGVNSVSTAGGLVALAMEADPKQDPGSVVFLNLDGEFLHQVQVGALPDMLTFTTDGERVVVANEGEPDDDYTVDPEGSISIIDLSGGVGSAVVTSVRFADFNLDGPRYDELPPGVRIFGPGASVAQDLEPEYVAITEDGTTAFVALQENNALAVIDILNADVDRIFALAYPNHLDPGHALDPSDRDDGIAINSWPVFGMSQPDAIATFEFNGEPIVLTANEGDARDYDGFSEEVRIKSLNLDPAAFPNAEELQEDENLGRLRVTDTLGNTGPGGTFQQLFHYGTRSFSLWNGYSGTQVFDSGEDFERITARQVPAIFNSQGAPDSFDSRSDDKGPEPEGAAVGHVDGRRYAFIGLERIGGVMVYDVSIPSLARFVAYEPSAPGDIAPEGLVFIDRADSPIDDPLLVVSNEVSGTVSIYSLDAKVPQPVPAIGPLGILMGALGLLVVGLRRRS